MIAVISLLHQFEKIACVIFGIAFLMVLFGVCSEALSDTINILLCLFFFGH